MCHTPQMGKVRLTFTPEYRTDKGEHPFLGHQLRHHLPTPGWHGEQEHVGNRALCRQSQSELKCEGSRVAGAAGAKWLSTPDHLQPLGILLAIVGLL